VEDLTKAALHVDTADHHLAEHFKALQSGAHSAAAGHFQLAASHLAVAANSLPNRGAGKGLLSDDWSVKGTKWHDPSDPSSVSLENIHGKINNTTRNLWSDLRSPGQPELAASVNTPRAVTEKTKSTVLARGAKTSAGLASVLATSIRPPKPTDEDVATLPTEQSNVKRAKPYAAPSTIPTLEPRQDAPDTSAALETRPYTPFKLSKEDKSAGEIGRRSALDTLMGTKEHWVKAEQEAAAQEDRPADLSKFYSSTAYSHPHAYRAEHGLPARTRVGFSDQQGKRGGSDVSGEVLNRVQGSQYANTGLRKLAEEDNKPSSVEDTLAASRTAEFHRTNAQKSYEMGIKEPVKNLGTKEESVVLPGLTQPQQSALKTSLESERTIQEETNTKANKRGEARLAARSAELAKRSVKEKTTGTPFASSYSVGDVAPQPSERGATAAATAAQRATASANAKPVPNRGPEATAIARTRASAQDKVRRTRASEFSLGML
jgi:hypothetical protein